jgi:hypothetical protein
MNPITRRFLRVYVLRDEETGGDAGGGGSDAAPQVAAAPAPADTKSEFSSAAEAVAELERRESARRAEAKAAKAQKEEAPAPAPAPKAEEDTSDAAGDDADEDLEDDTYDGDDVATDDEDADDGADLTTVSIDGKELEIPKGTPKALVERVQALASDLKSDYTRKTQEVAQERQTVQAAWSQAQQTAQQLQAAQAALLQFAGDALGSPPDLSLAQVDPQAYLVQRGLYEQRHAQLQALVQQGQAITAQQQAMQEQQRADRLAKGMGELLTHMPELKDPNKRAEFGRVAADVGAQYGFSQAEIAAIEDPRMILALRDLAKAKQALKTREDATKTVKAKLANVPPKTSKPKASAGQQGSRAAEAKAQFLRSGRTQKDLQRYLSSTSS